MNRIFLLDAYALVYRAYYAFIRSPRINSKGQNTSAILGFCNTLQEVLSKENPTHIGVAFDPHGPTFRHELYPEYKAQRQATPEDISTSVPIIKDILRAMHIPVIEVAGFEADDVIGTLALRWADADTQVYMLTPDKDYGQLVGDNRFIYRPRHGGGYEVMGAAEVCAKYNLQSPSQVIDLLGLMGDSSDNFPGCPGVGEKTAQKLIQEYGSIENLLKHTGEIKGALRTKLETHVDDINLSYRLATIRTDVPVEISLDSLQVLEPNHADLTRLFEELEFRTLLNKFVSSDVKIAKKSDLQLDLFAEFAPEESSEPENRSHLDEKTVQHAYKLVENEEEMREICKIILSHKSFVLDTETTSRAPMDAELVGMSFSVAPHEAWYVPVPDDRQQVQKIVDIFRPAFEDSSIEKVGQNIKYDIIVLMQYGVRMNGPLFDTMVAHYLIQPETHHNMDYMALTLLNYQTIPIEQLIGEKGRGQKSMRDVRKRVSDAASAKNLRVWQTEWSMLDKEPSELGGTYDNVSEFDIAQYMSRVIHNDIVMAGCTSWCYWTAMSVERYSQKNRFELFKTTPAGGNYSNDFTGGGNVDATHNLWVLSNYSRFIRPGYIRIGLKANEDKDFFGTAYVSPDGKTVVAVYTNYDKEKGVTLTNSVDNGKTPKTVTRYTTTATRHLEEDRFNVADNVFLEPASVTTVVYTFE